MKLHIREWSMLVFTIRWNDAWLQSSVGTIELQFIYLFFYGWNSLVAGRNAVSHRERAERQRTAEHHLRVCRQRRCVDSAARVPRRKSARLSGRSFASSSVFVDSRSSSSQQTTFEGPIVFSFDSRCRQHRVFIGGAETVQSRGRLNAGKARASAMHLLSDVFTLPAVALEKTL